MDIPVRTRELRDEAWRVGRVAVARLGRLPAWVVLTELFIGFGWLRAVAEKVIDPGWWRGEVLETFVATHDGMTLPWYEPFLETVVLPLAPVVAIVVVLAQLFAGVSLLTGRRLMTGLAVGMFLNLHFMATGAVTPSAFYLLAQGAIVLWLCERTVSQARAGALRLAATAATFLAAANIPFISTLHPREVIEDPAVMFAFGGALTAYACVLAARSVDAVSSRVPTGIADAGRPHRP